MNVVVHTVNDGGISVLARSGNEHLLRPLFDVHHRLIAGREGTGAFEHHVNAQISPGNFLRVTGVEDADAVAVDDHPVRAFRLHVGRKAPVHRVKRQKVGMKIDVARGVDGHDFKVAFLAAFIVRAQNVAADAAEPVDGYTNRHVLCSL